jgi:hypothetical protein
VAAVGIVDYHREASPCTANAAESRIIAEIESLPPVRERIRKSERVPGASELVVNKLPYVLFIQLHQTIFWHDHANI